MYLNAYMYVWMYVYMDGWMYELIYISSRCSVTEPTQCVGEVVCCSIHGGDGVSSCADKKDILGGDVTTTTAIVVTSHLP